MLKSALCPVKVSKYKEVFMNLGNFFSETGRLGPLNLARNYLHN